MKKYELAEKDYLLGMKYKEIAEKHGVSLNTVKSWKSRYKWEKVAKKVCTQKSKSMHTKKDAKLSKKTVEKMPNENYIESTELTEKQRLFCIFYIQNFNATQAAIKAGYSKESAYIIGYENLRKPYIKKYLSELKKMHENDLLLTEKRIIERYSKIAFSDMSDYLTEEGSLKNVSELDGTLIKKIKIKKKEVDNEFGSESTNEVAIELEDRSKALSFFSKYFGLDEKKKEDEEKKDNKTIKIEVID